MTSPPTNTNLTIPNATTGGPRPAALVIEDEANDLEAYLTRHDDGTATLRLAKPVTLSFRPAGGNERTETLEALTFRRPTGGDLRAIGTTVQGNPLGAGLELASRLTGQANIVIDKLDGTDAMRASGVALDFLAPSRRRTSGGG
jgi:hypothetical protein